MLLHKLECLLLLLLAQLHGDAVETVLPVLQKQVCGAQEVVYYLDPKPSTFVANLWPHCLPQSHPEIMLWANELWGKIAKWQIWNYDRSGLWSQHFHLLMLWPLGKLLHLSDPHVSYVKWRSLKCSTHVNPQKALSKRRQPSSVLRETCLIWAGCLESELGI